MAKAEARIRLPAPHFSGSLSSAAKKHRLRSRLGRRAVALLDPLRELLREQAQGVHFNKIKV